MSSISLQAHLVADRRAAAPDEAILARAAREIRNAIAPTSSERDRTAALPVEPIELIREAGIGALRIPVRYGGTGLSFSALVDVVIQIAAGDASTAQSLQPHFIFLERVRLMGSEAQRQRYLTACAEGALFGNAMSETGGRSGDWTTTVIRRGAGWRLNGRKFYATGSAIASFIFVGALNEANERVLVVVPAARAGVLLGDDWRAMGQRATASGSVVFSDVEIAPDEIIALAPWESRRHHTGAGSQIIHCAIDAGIAAAALDEAITLARTGSRASRESGHARVVDDPVAHHTVGDIASHAFAAQAAVLSAARSLDSAAQALFATQANPHDPSAGAATGCDVEPLLVQASIAVANAKIISSKAALHAAAKLFEVGGASAAASALNLDRHWRNARTHTLHDPIAHKYRVIGNHLLTGTAPPNSFTY